MRAFSKFLLCVIVTMVNGREGHKWANDFTLTSVPSNARYIIRKKWDSHCYDRKRTKSSDCVHIDNLLDFIGFDNLVKEEEYTKKYENSFQLLWNNKLRGILKSWFRGKEFPKMNDDPEEYFFLFTSLAPLELVLQYKLQFSRLTMYSKYLEEKVLKNRQSSFMYLSKYVDIFIDKLDAVTTREENMNYWELHKLESDPEIWRVWREIDWDHIVEEEKASTWKGQIEAIRKHYCGKNSPQYKKRILGRLEELKLLTNGINHGNREKLALKAFELYNKIIGLLIQEITLEDLSRNNDWKMYNRRKKEELVIRRVVNKGQVTVIEEWRPSLTESPESSQQSHHMPSSSTTSSRVPTSNPPSQYSVSPAIGSQPIRPSSSSSSNIASSSTSGQIPPSFPTTHPSSSSRSPQKGSSSSSSSHIRPSFPTTHPSSSSSSLHIGSSSSSSSHIPPSFPQTHPSSSSKSLHIGASTSSSNKNNHSSPSKFHDDNHPSSSSSRIPSSNPITTSPSTSLRQPSQSGKLPMFSSRQKSPYSSSSRQ